ncbi:hypothetical protein LCGC14_1741800, partial [marine sediment metagenome]
APNDESGVGKDYVTRNTLALFVPKEQFEHRTRISPTALNYWHNPKFEPEWTWNGVVLYLEDVSDNILNSEVMKAFLSGGSKATITVNNMAIEIEIKGKPIVMMTFANCSLNNEMLRRIELIPLDDSKEQTKNIKFFRAMLESRGKKVDYSKSILKAINSLKRVEVIIPEELAYRIADNFPNTRIVRTKLGRFFDLIKSSCAFYQHQRKKYKNGFLIAEGQDYDLAREVFEYVTYSSTAIPVSNNQKKIIETITTLGKTDVPLREILAKVNFIDRRSVYPNLDTLTQNGFLDKETKEENKGTEDYPKIYEFVVYSVAEKKDFMLPTHKELINQEMPSQASSTSYTSQGSQASPGEACEGHEALLSESEKEQKRFKTKKSPPKEGKGSE